MKEKDRDRENNDDCGSSVSNEPMMNDNDKTCFLFPKPHACAQTAMQQKDDRQMRMTDKDTPQRQRDET